MHSVLDNLVSRRLSSAVYTAKAVRAMVTLDMCLISHVACT
jgi:hypothetical protein